MPYPFWFVYKFFIKYRQEKYGLYIKYSNKVFENHIGCINKKCRSGTRYDE